jgi:hypothetical protein
VPHSQKYICKVDSARTVPRKSRVEFRIRQVQYSLCGNREFPVRIVVLGILRRSTSDSQILTTSWHGSGVKI